jgi:RibD C-terminal domain
MSRLKLQMQVSIDGMVAAQSGPAHFNWDEEVRQYSIANAANVDCILLGRKTATGFIPHWKSVAAKPQRRWLRIWHASDKHTQGCLLENSSEIRMAGCDCNEWRDRRLCESTKAVTR